MVCAQGSACVALAGQLGTQTFLGTQCRTDTATLPVDQPWLGQITSLTGVAGIPGLGADIRLAQHLGTDPSSCLPPKSQPQRRGPSSNPLEAQGDPPPGEVGGAALWHPPRPGSAGAAEGRLPDWASLAVSPRALPVPRTSPCGGPAPGGSLHARGLLPLPKVVPGLPGAEPHGRRWLQAALGAVGTRLTGGPLGPGS